MCSAAVPICARGATVGLCTMVSPPVAVAGVLGTSPLSPHAARRPHPMHYRQKLYHGPPSGAGVIGRNAKEEAGFRHPPADSCVASVTLLAIV
jgi:hypothetical protein